MIIGDIIHITHPNGEMNLFIDKFFPTTVKRADEVFKLVAENEPFDALILYHHIDRLEHKYFDMIDEYSKAMDDAETDESYKAAYEEHRYCLRKHDQAKRNKAHLKKIANLEV